MMTLIHKFIGGLAVAGKSFKKYKKLSKMWMATGLEEDSDIGCNQEGEGGTTSGRPEVFQHEEAKQKFGVCCHYLCQGGECRPYYHQEPVH
jgi:hypothetical protein